MHLVAVHGVPVEREFAALSECHRTEIADVWFFARMCMLVLLSVLLQTECFFAEFTLQFLDVVLLEVAFKREFRLEGLLASEDVAFKLLHD